MNYIIPPSNREYSMNYQELKDLYELYSKLTDENFMAVLPDVIHLACFISWLKGLKNNETISDEGIIHQLVHLLCGNDTSITLGEIREQFNTLLKLT